MAVKRAAKRLISVLRKSPHHPPVTKADYLVAEAALVQLAEEDGRMLTGPVTVTHSDYCAADRLYVAVYQAQTIIDPQLELTRHGGRLGQFPGASWGRAQVQVMRAHRMPLHAMQVIASAVEDALEPPAASPTGEETERERATRALIALHMLCLPVHSTKALAYSAEAVNALFAPPPAPARPRPRLRTHPHTRKVAAA